jgi:hypothetical protein
VEAYSILSSSFFVLLDNDLKPF